MSVTEASPSATDMADRFLFTMDSNWADGAISDECTMSFGRDPPNTILWLLLRRRLSCRSFVDELLVVVKVGHCRLSLHKDKDMDMEHGVGTISALALVKRLLHSLVF